MKVQVAGKAQYPTHLRMLLVGDHYAGKTTLALSAPDPLFIVLGNADTTSLASSGARFVEVSTEAELMELKKNLQSENAEEIFGGPVKTLVFDTVDELQRILLMNRLKEERRTNTKIDDWGWIGIRMNAIARGISSLDVHIIYLSASKTDEDGNIRPGLQGAFVDQIHNFVDVSALLTVAPMEPKDDSAPDVGDDLDLPQPGDRSLFLQPLGKATWVGNTLTEKRVVTVGPDTLGMLLAKLEENRSELPDTSLISSPVNEDKKPVVEIPGMSSDEELEFLKVTDNQKKGK